MRWLFQTRYGLAGTTGLHVDRNKNKSCSHAFPTSITLLQAISGKGPITFGSCHHFHLRGKVRTLFGRLAFGAPREVESEAKQDKAGKFLEAHKKASGDSAAASFSSAETRIQHLFLMSSLMFSPS